jgi:hypothetical protein
MVVAVDQSCRALIPAASESLAPDSAVRSRTTPYDPTAWMVEDDPCRARCEVDRENGRARRFGSAPPSVRGGVGDASKRTWSTSQRTLPSRVRVRAWGRSAKNDPVSQHRGSAATSALTDNAGQADDSRNGVLQDHRTDGLESA